MKRLLLLLFWLSHFSYAGDQSCSAFEPKACAKGFVYAAYRPNASEEFRNTYSEKPSGRVQDGHWIAIAVAAVIVFTFALGSLVLLALLPWCISLLVLSLLSAAILLWRVRKLKGLIIAYKDAYVVALKAGFCGLVVATVVPTALELAHVAGTWDVLGYVFGWVFAIVVWWNVHSRALRKLANTSIPLTVKDARTISTSVCGYLFVPLFVLGAISVVIIRHGLGIT